MVLTPDVLNGLFEFGGAFVIYLSIRRLLKDKTVKGVSWIMIAFFAVWGFWNLFYYPHLDQWFSFAGGIVITVINTFYVGLMLYYGYQWEPGHDVKDRGFWKETYSGQMFYLMDPQPEEIVFVDVAHSLAHQCRYTGHSLRWYSVAEHCCLLSDHVGELGLSPQHQLEMLMHDAAEAYTGDISRPMKYGIPGLKASLEHIDQAIAEAFGMPYPEPNWLKKLDARMIRDERAQNMVDSGNDWNHDKLVPLGITLEFWGPDKAKEEFTTRYNNLRDEIARQEKSNG